MAYLITVWLDNDTVVEYAKFFKLHLLNNDHFKINEYLRATEAGFTGNFADYLKGEYNTFFVKTYYLSYLFIFLVFFNYHYINRTSLASVCFIVFNIVLLQSSK